MIKDVIQKPEVAFWIAIIVPILGIAMGWGVFATRLSTLEDRFNYYGARFEARETLVNNKLEDQDKVFLDIQVRLAEIARDITFIREKVK